MNAEQTDCRAADFEHEFHIDHFANATVIGDYGLYFNLSGTIHSKKALMPVGWVITGTASEIKRLTDYMLTFGRCIQTLKGFAHACKLAGCRFTKGLS